MMGNFISREMARVEQQVRIYAPYIVPDLTDAPGLFRLRNTHLRI